ncbi:MAG: TonB-dependent receptor [Bacteroidales bacterium]|jgi:hypothetical protein|nr:TonB-dependent receptor [Bacteroidales bacterium]
MKNLAIYCLLFVPATLAAMPVSLPPDRTFTLSGYVTDAASGETLIGAHVMAPQLHLGAVTNEYGFFSLTLPEGKHYISVSYVGFRTLTQQIDATSARKHNFRLQANTELDAVVVRGERSETGVRATQMGAVEIPLQIIKSLPALMGEADVMKTVQMMPGVQAGTEGTAGLYVRGGGPDENLIMLDGVPLYNIDHLFGMFSIFTPEAVKKVNLFKSSFPARFGGRLSSVIDVRTNDGDLQNCHGTLNVGLLASKLQVEGPIIKNRTSFNISARRSYFDIPLKKMLPPEERALYYFYDLNGKINHRINDRHRLYLSLYSGRDKLESNYGDGGYEIRINNTDMRWGNDLAALRWNWDLSPRLFLNTTLAYTNYLFNVDNVWQEQKSNSVNITNIYVTYKSGIREASFYMDFDWHPAPTHQVRFGGRLFRHSFRPEVFVTRIEEIRSNPSDETYDDSNATIGANEGNIYAEDQFGVGRFLDFDLGFHASAFHVGDKTWMSLQPRMSVRLLAGHDLSFKAAYVRMSQYIHLLSNYMITLPTDLWVPATKNIRPMSADQYSVGAYWLGIPDWEFSIEAYYKDMNNVLEYKDGASFFGTSGNWQNKVEMGIGRAGGIEWMLQKKHGKTTGWLAYTLAKSERKFAPDGINEGRWFPYRYDRRHHISLALNHKFSDRIDCGASWEFYTGGTGTLAFQETAIIAPDAFVVSDGYNPRYLNGRDPYPSAEYIDSRNNYRMPPSHRLNVGINFHKRKKYGTRTWNVSIYNLYNAMNPAFMYTETETAYPSDYNPFSSAINPDVYEKKVLKKMTILPLLPSISYSYKF